MEECKLLETLNSAIVENVNDSLFGTGEMNSAYKSTVKGLSIRNDSSIIYMHKSDTEDEN